MEDSSKYQFNEFIDLLSSDSMDLYADNTQASFSNQLVVPQVLPSPCYVSCEELEYTSAFYNVITRGDKEGRARMSMDVFDQLYEYPVSTTLKPVPENPNPYPIYGRFVHVKLIDGNYDTPEKLTTMLNKVLKECGIEQLKNRDVFSYDPLTMKFSYDVSNLWITIFLRGDLLNYLGLDLSKETFRSYYLLGKSKIGLTYDWPTKDQNGNDIMVTRHWNNPKRQWQVTTKVKTEAEYVAQLTLVTSMCLYVDLIESQIAGSQWTSALRYVPIKEAKFGTRVIHQFPKSYFLKVNKTFVPSVKCLLLDVYGREVKFLTGHVRVKLKFTTQPPSV